MRYSTIFFDLDDTLYPSGNGLWEAIGARMNQYMIEELGLPAREVPGLRKHYFHEYGTTLRGLQLHHRIDSQEYLQYVHDLELNKFLDPAPMLDKMLSTLDQECWIFTNADLHHAANVMETLGIESRFEGIIDVIALDFVCKPEIGAFTRALEIAGNPEPGTSVFIDDSIENVLSAAQIGFHSILINKNGIQDLRSLNHMDSILDLPEQMPELWEK